ncbi:hypothetical protein [Estrella lausannensis]|uniref:Uncharacterized protein n=1 Tax=Estrella lausannensis TaxID=483423 RepID=A0A0H5DRF6_9BACT|nr:hypothetical protein [Estrella lausannensis]CRX38773.1 hypothetical protein ELAC_1437 [Estrella lausannensis]
MDVFSKNGNLIDQSYYNSHQADYSENLGWKHTPVSSQKTYLIEGREYKAIEKMERRLSLFSGERIKGILLGFACTLASGGLALISKRVRNWISGRQVVRVCVEKNSAINQATAPVNASSSKVSNVASNALTTPDTTPPVTRPSHKDSDETSTELTPPDNTPPEVPIDISSHQNALLVEQRVSHAADGSAEVEEKPPRDVPVTGTSAEILPTDPDDTKARLVGFYVNQQARLLDLKSKLAEASAADKVKIQTAIDRIDRSDMNNAKIALKVRTGNDPTPQELASYLGKSMTSVRGYYLGQAYSRAILENLPDIVSLMKADKTADPHLVEKISGLSNPTLEEMAKALEVSNEKAADILLDFMVSAAKQNEGSSFLQNLEAKIDGQVAARLGTGVEDIKAWVSDISKEKDLGLILTRLGEERKGVYDPDFKTAANQTFEKHAVSAHTSGMWTFFQKGDVPSTYIAKPEDAKQQWKLFLNPKADEFQSTLDRTLKALESMPYINGKIVASDTIKRKSDLTVVQDPCEPKLLLYFNGPDSAEDFQKAIQLLEKEFMDADMIAHPEGMRDKGNGVLEPQKGPSFTKERNPLMFYVQGGFTESGRHVAVQSGELDAYFEGENYYLHKGSQDPLKDLPGAVYSVGNFIAEMKANVSLFSQPFQLVKLQNMLNKLNRDTHPSPQVSQWKNEIRELMVLVSGNMGLEQMSSMSQLLEHWENMGDVKSATAKTFYQQLGENVSELEGEKGIVKAKIDHIEKAADSAIAKLTALNDASDLSSLSLQDILNASPPSLQYIMIKKILLENPDMKDQLIDMAVEEMVAKVKDTVVLNQTEEQIKNYFKMGGDIALRDGQLKIVRKGFWGDATLDVDSITDEPLSKLKELGLDKLPPQFNLKGDQFDAHSLIQLGLDKLQSIKKRQIERNEALDKGEAVVLSQYYHATGASAAASIAKTGIEASQAQSGFGAFISTEPEFRYGAVILGLPKEVEFKSQAATIFNKGKAGHILKNEQQVWAGLKKFITINPQMQAMQTDFNSGVQKVVSALAMPNDLSTDAQFELKERLALLCDRAVVFRAESENDKHKGFSLNYRELDINYLPAGGINEIKTEENLNKFAETMIRAALKQMNIPLENKDQIVSQLAAPFAQQFRSLYLEGKTIENDQFVLRGALPSRIKATVIAPDDELKDLFYDEFIKKNKTGSQATFKTLDEVKKEFSKQGFEEELVEFIPLAEQLIERDFLSEADAKVPQAWR